MTLTFQDLTKDITNVDIEDILSCWQWLVADMKAVAVMSRLGDLFLVGKDDSIYWLQTDNGGLTKVADDLQQFEQYLNDEDKVDNWFLPLLVEKLIKAGKTLKENEVYSYKKSPVIGGEYSEDNIEATDMSVHFTFTGEICQQIKDLPDGTKVNIKFEE
jgi:hypothetical protein